MNKKSNNSDNTIIRFTWNGKKYSKKIKTDADLQSVLKKLRSIAIDMLFTADLSLKPSPIKDAVYDFNFISISIGGGVEVFKNHPMFNGAWEMVSDRSGGALRPVEYNTRHGSLEIGDIPDFIIRGKSIANKLMFAITDKDWKRYISKKFMDIPSCVDLYAANKDWLLQEAETLGMMQIARCDDANLNAYKYFTLDGRGCTELWKAKPQPNDPTPWCFERRLTQRPVYWSLESNCSGQYHSVVGEFHHEPEFGHVSVEMPSKVIPHYRDCSFLLAQDCLFELTPKRKKIIKSLAKELNKPSAKSIKA